MSPLYGDIGFDLDDARKHDRARNLVRLPAAVLAKWRKDAEPPRRPRTRRKRAKRAAGGSAS